MARPACEAAGETRRTRRQPFWKHGLVSSCDMGELEAATALTFATHSQPGSKNPEYGESPCQHLDGPRRCTGDTSDRLLALSDRGAFAVGEDDMVDPADRASFYGPGRSSSGLRMRCAAIRAQLFDHAVERLRVLGLGFDPSPWTKAG